VDKLENTYEEDQDYKQFLVKLEQPEVVCYFVLFYPFLIPHSHTKHVLLILLLHQVNSVYSIESNRNFYISHKMLE
jgi:hypothetical protein